MGRSRESGVDRVECDEGSVYACEYACARIFAYVQNVFHVITDP